MLDALRRARGTIDSLVGQMEQMRGMFDDADGAIAETLEDADETSEYLAELCGAATGPTPFTVILRAPNCIADDSHAGTLQFHITSTSPKAAFGTAQDIALAESGHGRSLSPNDFAVVAVFSGHLHDLHIP